MNDIYPPFSAQASFDVNVDIPVGNVRRLAVLFRLVLLIPAQILNSLVALGLGISAFFIWLTVLVRGSMPPSLFEAMAAVLRFQARTTAYAMMLTGKYPGELFGEKPTASDDAELPSEFSSPQETTPPTLQNGSEVVGADEPLDDSVTSAAPHEDQETDRADAALPPAEFTAEESTPVPPEPPRMAGLVLNHGAKVILVIFLVLGGLGYVGEIVVGATRSGESSLISLENANGALSNEITLAKAHDKTCSLSESACAAQYLKELDVYFSQFRSTVDGISFPSSARADATRFEGDSSALVSLLDQMTDGQPTTQAQVNSFQTLATAFDTDFSRVVKDLSRSSL
jgi:Domain of unknown function (DUF4389)